MADYNFNIFRGLADSKWSGIKGSFAKLVGLDIHSTPGVITVRQALAKHSGTTITALCRVAVSVSDASRLWFSYTDGKIWREASGTYTLVYTTSPAAGNAGCLGAAEYDGFIYWATQSRLHRIATTNIGSAASWTANAAPNWATFGITDSEFHPMKETNQTLFIGDGNRMASVDNTGTFNANVLDIEPPHRIKTMKPYDVDLVIGTTIASTINRCKFIRWDTVQTTWQFAFDVLENGINELIWLGGIFLAAQAGRYGNFYLYDGNILEPYKRLPLSPSASAYGEVHPNSSGNLLGVPIFGFSNGAGNPADQGIYSLGNYSKDYPRVISGTEFVISSGAITGVDIGAILVEDNDLYLAWSDGSNFGVDKMDYAAKYASAYMDFLMMTPDPIEATEFVKFIANYTSMPSGASLTYKYKDNYSGSWKTFGRTAVDDTDNFQYWLEDSVRARAFQFQVNFNVSGNNAPQIESFIIQTA